MLTSRLAQACAAALFIVWPALAELPAEKITVATMMPDNGHRLYVIENSIPHGVDGKVQVIDGDSFRILGQITNGQMGSFNTAANGKTLYNATTFFSRGDHGTYSNVLEFYDPASLLPTDEIVLGTKRAQSTGVVALMPESAKGQYLFMQNATPASSVSIIDLAAHKVIAELPLSGCFGIYPSASEPRRFSSLCGDGTLVTIGFDANGAETSRKRSDVFFDSEKDPLFITGMQAGSKMFFISFLGQVHEIDVSGDKATQSAVWSILSAVPASENWRPGGTLPIAYNDSEKLLYVGMHPNGHEGSHKDSAQEIWKVDVGLHAVVARNHADGATSLAVSQGSAPVLFTINGDFGSITRYDGKTLTKLGETRRNFLEGGGPLVVQ